MKEIKFFTIIDPKTATDFARFLDGNKITFTVTDYSHNYFDPKIVFKCEMDKTEARIAETIIKYGEYKKYEREDVMKKPQDFYISKGRLPSKTVFEKLFWNHNPDEPFIKLRSNKNAIPEIKEVVFNNPATIIFWEDSTKTIVKTQNGEPFDKEKGFCMAVVKKLFGNKGNYYNIVNEWINKKAKIYDDSSKKKSNKTCDHKNEITKKRIRKDV